MELLPIHSNAIKSIKSILLEYDFYLAGGTAVCYYLYHRNSEDLDFFTKLQFNEDILQKRLEPFPISLKAEGTIYANIKNIKVSFFYYPYELLYEINKMDTINMANLLDILPMKINAVINRGSKKDFIDIYFIMKHLNLNGKDVLKICLNKFKNMNEMIFLKSLIFFEDADIEIIPKMIKNVEWEDIKRFIKYEFISNY